MPRGFKEREGEDSQAEGADEQGQEEEGIGAEDKEKGAEAEAGKAEEEIGATRAREAKERDDASLAERIRYGKKGRAAANNIHGQTYKEKPGHAAGKKTWNRSTNQRASIKVIKRNYDKSERAKIVRRPRLLRFACSS